MSSSENKKKIKNLKAYTIHTDTVLGRGSYATVYLGFRKSDQKEVGIKIVDKRRLNPKTADSLEHEIATMQSCKHENIIELYDVYRSKNHIYLVMEMCKGGDLAHFVKNVCNGKLNDSLTRRFLAEIARGLKYMNDRKIIHRDLKPQNLLITISNKKHAHLKIADFGFAKTLGEGSLADTLCGSPLYMAPEIFHQKPYNSKADLWSVGAILYEMKTGGPPFPAASIPELLKKFEQKLIYPPDLDKDCLDLLKGLLQVNPKNRFSFDQFYNHKYVQQCLADNPPLDPSLLEHEEEQRFVMVNLDQIEGFEPSPLKKNSLSIKLTDSGHIKYLPVIFDFTSQKHRYEDKNFIQDIENNAKWAWSIAEFAMLLEKYHKPLEALAIYTKSVELLYSTFKRAKNGISSERLHSILRWIRHRIEEFLERAEATRSQCTKLASNLSQSPEYMLYEYALKLAKDAAFEEYLDKKSNCIVMYTRAKYIFEYLNAYAKIRLEDRKSLQKCINMIKKRLNSLKDVNKEN